MGEIPPGLSFDENDDGFVLHRKGADSAVTSITMSKEELLGLYETIVSWRDRVVTEAQAKSGQVQAIVFQPVVDFGLAHETLGQHILLTLVAPTGGRRTFALPPHVAEGLVEHLPPYLAEMNAANPTRQ
jgi:hypothetical protein